MSGVARAATAAGIAGLLLASLGTAAGATVTELCGGLQATIVGTDGNDDIVGTDGPDVIAALGGNDLVEGGGGADVICSGDGTDALYGGAGRDRLIMTTGGAVDGGPQSDVIDASAAPPGTVTAYYLYATRRVIVDLVSGTARGAGRDTLTGVDNAYGSGFDDRLIGGAAANFLYAGPGDDRLIGGPGDDLMFGAADQDTVVGQDGNDLLQGGSDSDEYRGGPGRDDLRENSEETGDDSLSGGPGPDLIYGGLGIDNADGGPHSDYCAPDIENKVRCERP